MRLGILAGGMGWHVRDLERAASTLGIPSIFLDVRTLDATVRLRAWTTPLDSCQAAIVRTMPPGSLEQIIFRMDVLHAAAAAGLSIVNPPRCLEMSVDKYLTTQRLAQAGLPVPPTRVCQTAQQALACWEELGGDVVLKPLFGAEGRGLMRISDRELAWRTFHTLERLHSVLYLQSFIPNPGWDVRVLVLDGQVRTAMRRIAVQDWRTNITQGADAEPFRVTAELQAYALQAASSVHARLAGVDLLPGLDGGWYVLEVNAVPGWRKLASITGIDVAQAVVQSACRLGS